MKKLATLALGLLLSTSPAFTNTIPTTPEVDENPSIEEVLPEVNEKSEVLEEPEVNDEPLTLEDAFKTSVILNITREVPEVIPHKYDKKGRIIEEGNTIYHQIEITCSGNYISSNHILTNRHCIEKSIKITADTGKEIEEPVFHMITREGDAVAVTEKVPDIRDAEIIYTSPDVDLALLYTEIPSDYWLEVATETPKIGTHIYTYGHPMGISFTLTEGIVSRIHENENYILMDQTILPGNSGSAVLNDKYQLVGVANALINSNPFILAPTGLSVAVSAKAINNFLDKLRIK